MNPKLLLILSLFCLLGSTDPLPKSAEQLAEEWVDSTFNRMTQEERLGQLFVIRAHSDKGPEHIASVESQIRQYHVGGLCFFQGTPEKQAELTNRYQQLSKVPLMVSIDAEWGLGMRMKETTMSFPKQLTLGAIQDNRLIYEMGKQIAEDCKRIGIHVNFAPVADINNNSKNPVINTRSFGEDRQNVSVKSYMYMRGMQDNGVMACAKHFPGHGDTGVDSHYDLPVISHDVNRLDSIELYPFQVLANQGIQSMMVAHLNVPALDSTEHRPTSLSSKVVTDLLKNKMAFHGLVFTDGLEMKGVTKYFKAGIVEAEALLAGSDILLLPDDIGASMKAIQQYLAEGKLTITDLNQRVKKILLAKYNYNLHNYRPVNLYNIREDLNSPKAQVLKRNLIQNALTLVTNKEDLIPIRNLDQTSISTLSIGAQYGTTFQNALSKYGNMRHYQVSKDIPPSKFQGLLSKLYESDVVLVGLHDMSSYTSKNFGITNSTKIFLKALSEKTKVVLTVFGNPYALKYFEDLDWILNAYEEDDMTQEAAAQALMGAYGITGRLPVTASNKARFNQGVTTNPIARMGYGLPESVGLNSKMLNNIDLLMKRVLDTVASPGGVVLVAKDGKVVFNKAYGYHTYQKRQQASTNDIYDLASITKIAAATISVMKLYDEGKIDINKPVSEYLPELKHTNKSAIIIKDVMAHVAGLKSWIPFYEETVDKRKKPKKEFYRGISGSGFDNLVADNLYLRSSFEDEIWKQIYESPMNTPGQYVYSDLGFYLIAKMIQRITGQSIDVYVQEQFYKPLGLTSMTYNPLEKFAKEQIVPTEEDTYWRRQKVHGHVHDMGAAMLKGVSGHAGLFSNANDLAILMQLLLNKVYYGGKQYFSPETVKIFTQRHPYSTRRGIGFDLLETNPQKEPNLSTKASLSTFGHLGFTGTCAWADPINNIIYIFLSNRTYPKMNNKKLYNGNFRPRGQDIVYDALWNGVDSANLVRPK